MFGLASKPIYEMRIGRGAKKNPKTVLIESIEMKIRSADVWIDKCEDRLFEIAETRSVSTEVGGWLFDDK